jgi:hypothetical protein
MLGNVSEWCNDWYHEDTYKLFPSDTVTQDPSGPDDGSEKVYRGGSWSSKAFAIACAYREYAHPTEKSNTCGFRVLRIASPTAAIQLGAYEPLPSDAETTITQGTSNDVSSLH